MVVCCISSVRTAVRAHHSHQHARLDKKQEQRWSQKQHAQLHTYMPATERAPARRADGVSGPAWQCVETSARCYVSMVQWFAELLAVEK